MRTNLHDILQERADGHADEPAVAHRDTVRTRAQLWEDSAALASGLLSLGLGREERVAILLEKRLETVSTIFGTSAAGGAFVPVNPVLRPHQVAYILQDCDVTVLVTSAARLALLRPVLQECPALRHVIVVDGAPGSSDPGPPAVHQWTEVVSSADPVSAAASTDQDMAAILYTSGSTGRPKGVVLSHRNLIVGAESVSSYLGNTADDVILAALPFSFDAGLSQLTTGCSVGARVVLMDYLLPRDVPRLCARHEVTGLTCVPPLWIQIAEQEWPPEATARLRYFANTGGRMPRATLDRLRRLFPAARPFLMYGLTEAFRSTYLDPDQVDRRPDSIGKAIPNAEIIVVRSDGSPAAPGEEGELVHRGPLVALGYWNDVERTTERFRPVPGRDQPWRTPETAVWSGDTVVTDEEGYLYFVGRRDEMIKTSGYRVSPTEIEEAAFATGQVRDAVALGVEDARLGQRVLLVVSPAGDCEVVPDALVAAMRKELPTYMVPETVLVQEEIPRSPNGKYDRAGLREGLHL